MLNKSYKIAGGTMFIRDGYFINIYKLACDGKPRVYIKKLNRGDKV